MERLQKFLARCGVASRRKSEEYIQGGLVKVNGKVETELGTKINPMEDLVEFKGKTIKAEAKKVYILLNKPTGYITTVDDEKGRPKVTDLLRNVKERVYPVGRLDYDTEGLLLLTNDGELTYALTHPKYKVTKTYHALLEGVPSEEKLKTLRTGVMLEDGITAPAEAKVKKKIKGNTLVSLAIHEGRNRQVRRMGQAIGHKVIKLKRVKFDFLTLDNLPVGTFRNLTDEEVKKLSSLAKRKRN